MWRKEGLAGGWMGSAKDDKSDMRKKPWAKQTQGTKGHEQK